jgi:hypothetical protein
MAVYLIHFEQPFHHARHYVGYTDNLQRRFNEHVHRKNSSPLLVAASAAGIAWRVAMIWPQAGRDLERLIKRTHHTARYCPECGAKIETDLPKYALELMRWVLPQPGDHLESTRN